MKKIFIITFLLIGLIIQSKAQTIDANSLPKLAPGIIAPISYPNNPIILTPTGCDNPDIRIFPSPNPQSEVHLSINKQNPLVLLLSANTFPTFNSQQGAYWSTNGGLNWNGSDNLPNGAFGRSDPSTAFDAIGNGYVGTLNAIALNAPVANGYLIQRTNNNGATWQPQVHGADVNGSDKEMIAADDVPTSPFANNFYCAWSVNPGANGIVQFNRSTNQGATFSVPITIRNGWGQGTNVQTGSNGEVYVCWADYTNGNFPEQGLGFVRSTNGGQNFTASSVVFNYTGIRQSDNGDPLFGNTRVNSFPSMAVDKSNGAHRGRIYVVYTQKENGNGRAIISLRFSDNTGTTWSNATTINIPNGRQNWFPWVAVDDTNGDVFITYYSLDAATGFSTNTYVASSNDGGATFVNQRVSDVAHVTAPIAEFGGGYAGDYIGITSNSGRAFAGWMDNRSGQWQVYVSQVRDIDIVGDNIFCATSNNYTLTNLPTGATVQWQVTPANIAIPNSPMGTQTTLTKQNSGIITLTATISNACGSPITVTKPNIIVGTLSTTITGPSSLCPCTCCNMYSTINIPGAAYSWTVTPSSGNSVSGTGNQAEVIITSPCTLKVEITTACGTISSTLHIFVKSLGQCNGGCSSPSYIIAPNPAHSSVNISVFSSEKNMKVKGLQSSSSENEKVFNGIKLVNIYNTSGKLNRQEQFSGNPSQVQIDISKLPIGVYVVEISDGKYKEQQKLVISR